MQMRVEIVFAMGREEERLFATLVISLVPMKIFSIFSDRGQKHVKFAIKELQLD